MKSRFFIVVLAVFIIFSCDHFVNLGDKSADGADYTEGLPDEIYEGENSDSADTGNYDDWNEDSAADTDTYDEGENAPADDGIEPGEPGEPGNQDEDADSDPDTYYDADDTSHEFPDEDPCRFPDCDPFPEEFSHADCDDCGETPDYEPVCCNGVISVFNSCFAKCYAINSSNKICSVYQPGLCNGNENESEDDGSGETSEPDAEEGDQDTENADDDDEIPDSDEDAEAAGCGCYPENEPSIFRCGESFYFITECLASCHCDDPQKLFL